MKNSRLSLPVTIIACLLTIGLTAGLSAKDYGYYIHIGQTHWDGFEAPSLEDEIGLPGVSIDYELDTRTKLSLGLGFHLNEQWSFEGLYVSTPEQVVSGNNWVFPPLQPGGDPITLSWNAKIEQQIGVISAIYDVYINENISVFGKGGIAFVKSSSSQHVAVENFPSSFFENIVPNSLTQDEEYRQEFYGAIGFRVARGKASATFTYQYIETPDEPETSLEVGFQWNL